MSPLWTDFLESIGASCEAEDTARFAGGASCPDTFITALPRFAPVLAEGSEAAAFLQAQLTCDVDQLATGTGTPAAWCNPKGRVITTLLLYRPGPETFLLLCPRALKDSVLKRLGMYVLRSDVRLTDAGEERVLIGWASTGAGTDRDPAGAAIEPHNGGYRVSLPGPGRRAILIDTPADLEPAWRELAREYPAADSRCWDRLDIAAGLAWLETATSEAFLPQELNLEFSGGLSFSKGCYPGQEVVARVHYRGRVKRRLFHGLLEADAAGPGTPLVDLDSGSTVGTVLAAAPEGDRSHAVLAVITQEVAQREAIGVDDGQPLRGVRSVPGE